MARQKQSDYQAKYDAEHMIQYTVKYNKLLYFFVQKALEDSGMNRNQWTTQAIIEKLERDGYNVEWEGKSKGRKRNNGDMD